MVLHGKERVRLVGEAFEALIVQIDVGRDRAYFRQRAFVHREAVVLAGDFDSSGGEVAYWVVDAVMPKLALGNVCIQRAGDQLLLEVEALRNKSRTGHVKCKAKVGDVLAAEANLKFMMADADPWQ